MGNKSCDRVLGRDKPYERDRKTQTNLQKQEVKVKKKIQENIVCIIVIALSYISLRRPCRSYHASFFVIVFLSFDLLDSVPSNQSLPKWLVCPRQKVHSPNKCSLLACANLFVNASAILSIPFNHETCITPAAVFHRA